MTGRGRPEAQEMSAKDLLAQSRKDAKKAKNVSVAVLKAGPEPEGLFKYILQNYQTFLILVLPI